MFMTNEMEKKVLNLFKNNKFNAPANGVWVGLLLNDPGEVGTAGVEVSYAGYERKQVKFGEFITEGNKVSIKNSEEVLFTKANVAVGTVTYIGYFDNKIGGTMLAYGKLTDALDLTMDEAPALSVGELTLSMSVDFSLAFKKQILGIFKGTSVNGFETFLALYNNSPDADGTEFGGASSNYARIKIEWGDMSETGDGFSKITNKAMLKFASPNGVWGTVTHFVVCSAEQGNSPVVIVKRETSKEIIKGYQIMFDEGTFGISVN